MRLVIAALAAGSVVWIGCGNPCRDYCETFIDRTQECGLGGPSGDAAVDECGEDVGDTLEDDVCEASDEEVGAMSCADFKFLVCRQPGAAQTYNCSP